jgi:hypothetical protein
MQYSAFALSLEQLIYTHGWEIVSSVEHIWTHVGTDEVGEE